MTEYIFYGLVAFVLFVSFIAPPQDSPVDDVRMKYWDIGI